MEHFGRSTFLKHFSDVERTCAQISLASSMVSTSHTPLVAMTTNCANWSMSTCRVRKTEKKALFYRYFQFVKI